MHTQRLLCCMPVNGFQLYEMVCHLLFIVVTTEATIYYVTLGRIPALEYNLFAQAAIKFSNKCSFFIWHRFNIQHRRVSHLTCFAQHLLYFTLHGYSSILFRFYLNETKIVRKKNVHKKNYIRLEIKAKFQEIISKSVVKRINDLLE